MRNIIAIFLFLATTSAQAGDLYLDINGYSWHDQDTYAYKGVHPYNTNNAGLGMTYSANKYLEVSAGFYENSYYARSIYGGAKIKYEVQISDLTLSPGIGLGVVTGYRDTPSQVNTVQVFVIPTLRMTYRGVGLTVGYVPGTKRGNLGPVSTITLQFNFRVGRF